MKTKYIILICAIAIFCCLIVTVISTINSDYDDNLNEINLTDEYDSDIHYTITEDTEKTPKHHEPYKRDSDRVYISEDEYYDTYDYGDNYEIDNYLESEGGFYY